MFSRSCQYALQAVLYIALHGQNRKSTGAKEIALSQDIPLHFLSKILQTLVKNKVLKSVKGPRGGFSLSKAADEQHLLRIVEVVDGLEVFDRCGIGMKVCSDKNPCPIHNNYKIVKESIRNLLTEKTLAELCEDVKDGKSFVSYVE